MKVCSLLAGLGVCLGATGFANAQIWTGYSDGYFSQVYATDLAGTTNLPQYNAQCDSKYWRYMKSPFHVDFRVNTEGAASAFITFIGAETGLNGTFDAKSGGYGFRSDKIAQAHKDARIQSLYFSVNSQFNRSYARLVLEGGDGQPMPPSPVPNPPQPNPPLPIPSAADCYGHCGGDDNRPPLPTPVPPATTPVAYQCVLATVY